MLHCSAPGLTTDSSEKKTPKMKGGKKKKPKKIVSSDAGKSDDEDDGDATKEEVSKQCERINSGVGQKSEDSALNVDSMIENYKVKVLPKTDFLENLLNDEQAEESEEDTTSTNFESGTKSTRFSKKFKRNRQTMEKTRQNLVKKENEDEQIQRAGQLLKKVTQFLKLCSRLKGNTIFLQTLSENKGGLRWGGVQFTAKRVTESGRKKEEFYWDEREEPEDAATLEGRKSISGIRSYQHIRI